MSTSEVLNAAESQKSLAPAGMTPEQRLQATIELKPVDRIVCSLFVFGYAARFAGVTQAQFLNDWDLAQQCMDKLKAAYPIWDCIRSAFADMGYGPILRNRWFQKVALPGEELPEDSPFQIHEESLATQEELRAVMKTGMAKYMMAVTKRIRPDKGLLHYLLWEWRRNRLLEKDIQAAYRRGQTFYYGGTFAYPFEVFSMTRGMTEFNTDLYRLRDELVDIMWKVQKDTIDSAVKSARRSGIPRIFVVGTRCTPTFLRKAMFDKFSWPFLKDGALRLIENGLTPVFHLDTNWDREMERFLELPKGKCIVETDGASNIFRAKEILKDHVCLAGDVLPALLTTGSATETAEYCKRLIDVVGKGGGYIFSNGCTMPADSRHENVKAMMDTIARYGRYD